jgi:uncharacterized protein YjeT (DUF2065 family)
LKKQEQSMDWKMRLKKMEPNTVGRALGWFSVGLGLLELAAPRALARATGMSESDSTLLRAYGARELGTGVVLLRSMDPAPWLWGRVAGDALDIATVGYRGWQRAGGRTRAMVTLGMLAGVTAVDIWAARKLRQQQTQTPVKDYSQRSGFSKPAAEMRGVARQERDSLPRATVMPAGSVAPTSPTQATGQPPREQGSTLPPSLH